MVRPRACSGSGTDRTTVRSRRRRLHPAAATKCRPRRHQPPLGRLTPRPAQVRSLQAIEDHCTTLSFHVATSRSECVDFIAHNVVEDTQLKTLSAFITIAFIQLFGITTAAVTSLLLIWFPAALVQISKFDRAFCMDELVTSFRVTAVMCVVIVCSKHTDCWYG